LAGGPAIGSFGSGIESAQFYGQRGRNCHHSDCGLGSVLLSPAPNNEAAMMYQLGWSTQPGLRGLSVSDFRATPTGAPDNERGVAIELESNADRDAFVREIEAAFAARRFTNAADAFDTVKAYALDNAGKRL